MCKALFADDTRALPPPHEARGRALLLNEKFRLLQVAGSRPESQNAAYAASKARHQPQKCYVDNAATGLDVVNSARMLSPITNR